jgi:hypothetical protein
MRTAVDCAVRLNAVTHDPDSAARALGRDGADRALETIENAPVSVRHHDREGLVVFVTATLAFRHD